MSNFGVFAKRYINKPVNYAMKSLEYKRLEFNIKMGYYDMNLEKLQEARKIGQDIEFLLLENNISYIVCNYTKVTVKGGCRHNPHLNS